MRTILVMRHASAAEAASDHARPLSARGQSESARVGRWMRERGHRPEQIVASPAVRAVSTAEVVQASFPEPPPLSVDPDLYLGSRQQLLDCLGGMDDACGAVLLVAHNPGAAELAAWLLGGAAPAARKRLAAGFQPGAVGVFAFDRPRWTELVRGNGTLVDFTTPAQAGQDEGGGRR